MSKNWEVGETVIVIAEPHRSDRGNYGYVPPVDTTGVILEVDTGEYQNLFVKWSVCPRFHAADTYWVSEKYVEKYIEDALYETDINFNLFLGDNQT